MDDEILARIDSALRSSDIPAWAIPILLAIRDDHRILHDHIRSHQAWKGPIVQIMISVIAAITSAATIWYLFGK